MPQQFYTTLVCLGNHENYSLVEKIPQEDWRGAKVRRARENVLILERGGMYDLNGVTLWTMGGAASHDMEYRIPGRSWFPIIGFISCFIFASVYLAADVVAKRINDVYPDEDITDRARSKVLSIPFRIAEIRRLEKI